MRAPAVEIRPLLSRAELSAAVQLQRQVWGDTFTNVVPASILKISQRVGGISAGAFAEDGEMLGFVFGLAGYQDGALVQWSDMLAVRPGLRDHGIGWQLKMYQRRLALAAGVTRIIWTFDPLQSRNAYFNLSRLGAEVVGYEPDFYGADTGSFLHGSIGTDRLIVCWSIAAERVAARVSGPPCELPSEARAAPANLNAAGEPQVPAVWPDTAWVQLAIPADIEGIKAASLELGKHWRELMRLGFEYYLGCGYVVRGFRRGKVHGAYCLQRGDRE